MFFQTLQVLRLVISDDWSDPEYDLSEDESETDESFDGRVDGFMAIQPRLTKNSDDDDRLLRDIKFNLTT